MLCGTTGLIKANGPSIRRRWWEKRLSSFSALHRPEMGARVAAHELTDAVIKHLNQDLYLVANARDGSALEQAVSPFRSQTRKIEVVEKNSLELSLRSTRLSGWIDGSGNFSRPFEVRKRFSEQQYPILFTHHTVSYRGLIYDTFLPMLLSGTHSWDALICSSRASSVQLSDLFANLSETLREENQIDLRFKGSFHVVPYGIDTDRFKPGDQVSARKRLGLPKRAFIFLFLGRVSAFDKADLMPLLLAAKLLSEKHPRHDFRIVIAGGMVNDYRDLLNALAAELGLASKVLHVLKVPAEDLVSLYNAADVFVSPAENAQECFGLAVAEALSCGLPQIVTDWSGYRDITVDGETGFLIPTLRRAENKEIELSIYLNPPDWLQHHFSLAQSTVISIDHFTAAMSRLLTDTDLRKSMAVNSRKRAKSFFSWETVIPLYNQVLKEKQAILASEHRRADTRKVVPTTPLSMFTSIRHFSTYLIEQNTKFTPTAFHRDANKIANLYEDHYRGFEFQYPVNVKKILEGIRSPQEFESLVGDVVRLEGVSRPVAELQVAWMAKVGMLAWSDGDLS